MNEIVSVPSSIRARFEQAEKLLALAKDAERSGEDYDAATFATRGLEIMLEVARQSPEYGALVCAAKMGYTGIQYSTYERTDSFQVVEHKFLGFTIGTETVPVSTTKQTHRIVKLI